MARPAGTSAAMDAAAVRCAASRFSTLDYIGPQLHADGTSFAAAGRLASATAGREPASDRGGDGQRRRAAIVALAAAGGGGDGVASAPARCGRQDDCAGAIAVAGQGCFTLTDTGPLRCAVVRRAHLEPAAG